MVQRIACRRIMRARENRRRTSAAEVIGREGRGSEPSKSRSVSQCRVVSMMVDDDEMERRPR